MKSLSQRLGYPERYYCVVAWRCHIRPTAYHLITGLVKTQYQLNSFVYNKLRGDQIAKCLVFWPTQGILLAMRQPHVQPSPANRKVRTMSRIRRAVCVSKLKWGIILVLYFKHLEPVYYPVEALDKVYIFTFLVDIDQPASKPTEKLCVCHLNSFKDLILERLANSIAALISSIVDNGA